MMNTDDDQRVTEPTHSHGASSFECDGRPCNVSRLNRGKLLVSFTDNQIPASVVLTQGEYSHRVTQVA